MQKIGASTASANPLGEFTEGNPGAGVPATLLKASWLNAIQRELVHLVEGAGLTLDAADDYQILKAIQAIQTIAGTWLKLSGKPTTVAGFGITDAFTKTETTSAIQQRVAELVASSPAALDTLKELAAALGNDSDFATTMANALAGKANKATTLGGYGIGDVYTKPEIDQKVGQATESNKGTSRFGTSTEQLAGLLTTVMSNPAGVLALLTAWFPRRTFAYRDYIRIPDVPGGLIIQWGRDSNATAGPITVTLPAGFPASKWLEISTPILGSPSGWDVSQSAGGTSLSQSIFYRRSGNGTTTNALSNFDIFWVSLGF